VPRPRAVDSISSPACETAAVTWTGYDTPMACPRAARSRRLSVEVLSVELSVELYIELSVELSVEVHRVVLAAGWQFRKHNLEQLGPGLNRSNCSWLADPGRAAEHFFIYSDTVCHVTSVIISQG
jgi:hypothetical protein